MTAFARVEQAAPEGALVCEMRSVNHRYLEVSVRLPDTVRELEIPLRDIIRGSVGRGKVDCTVRLTEEADLARGQAVDPHTAAQLKALVAELSSLFETPLPLNPVDLLRWPGLLKGQEVDHDALVERTRGIIREALAQLVETRAREGAELKSLLLDRLTEIDRAVGTVREQMPRILENHRAQLRARLDQLTQDVDEARLEQEMVYLVQKSDVAEELDRLVTHVEEVRRVLEEGGVVGRRLDFLMQELNREANTLSSKAITAETSLQAVDLKVLIEQMREQVQNIE